MRVFSSRRFNIFHAWFLVRQYIGHIFEKIAGKRIIWLGNNGLFSSLMRLKTRYSIDNSSIFESLFSLRFSLIKLLTIFIHSGKSSISCMSFGMSYNTFPDY